MGTSRKFNRVILYCGIAGRLSPEYVSAEVHLHEIMIGIIRIDGVCSGDPYGSNILIRLHTRHGDDGSIQYSLPLSQEFLSQVQRGKRTIERLTFKDQRFADSLGPKGEQAGLQANIGLPQHSNLTESSF